MLSLVLSFALAALWVSVATVVTERLGTKVGGVVTTLPSTLVVALYFMAVEEGADFASETALVVPAELGVNVVFIAIFVAASGRGLVGGLAAAYAGWLVMSAAVFFLDVRTLVPSLAIYAVCVIGSSLWLRARHPYAAQKGKAIRYTPGEIAFRGLFAGVMIALSVFLASVSGPVMGGIMSVFPAIFTSTMVILYLRQGRDFTGAAGRTMIFGAVNTTFFAVLASYTLPLYGTETGIVLSLAISYVWSFGIYQILKR